jgi:hypothetical protein
MTSRRMRIFISYRRADAIGHAGRLHDELQARFGRDRVFMDLSGIQAGEDFVSRIDAAIRACDALVVVIGDEWLSSVQAGTRRLDRPDDLVRAEVSSALQRGIPVVPVLVEGARMPAADDLPEPLKPLATRHAQELSDARWSYDIEQLVRALEKIGGASRQWRHWIAAAAMIGLIAVLGVWLLTRGAEDRAAAVTGEWNAEVTYSWGAKYRELFSLEVDGLEITGTASFLGVPRGIVRGALTEKGLAFETTTQEVLGDWNNPRDVVHRYRGAFAEDGTIAFTMQSEGGSSSLPIEFTAHRSTLPAP